MRKLTKMQNINDGNRSLFESILPIEIITALEDWKKSKIDAVLVGGVALSFYVKPRMTQDIDFLFEKDSEIPETIPGFKKIRKHSFQHYNTHVEIKTLSPEFLSQSNITVTKVFETSIISNGIKIASPSGLIAMKLGRLTMQDKADIMELIKNNSIDLTGFGLSQDKIEKYLNLVIDAQNEPKPLKEDLL